MVNVLTVAFLLFGYATAQDADCDFRQDIGPGQSFFINNNYKAGRVCRYIATCTAGYNCRFDCDLNMPASINCSGDRLLLSKTGDPTLAAADAYCGRRSVSVVSTGRSTSAGLIATATSPGGSFTCSVSCQPEPITPAPPLCSCGKAKATRIVNGKEAKPNEFPMMAAFIDSSTELIHCGGVIISERYIMTAAHCLYLNRNRPKAYYVSLGDHNIEDESTGTRYDFERFITHENFNPNTYDNDIGLARTDVVMRFTAIVQPVCLPFKYVGVDLTGITVTEPGWGSTSFGGPTSDVLRKVDVSVVDQNRCKATAGTTVTDRQICTNGTGDACQMDSGGPLLWKDVNLGLLFTFGIVSSGTECANGRPAVNTRVTELLRWVVNNANSQFCIIR